MDIEFAYGDAFGLDSAQQLLEYRQIGSGFDDQFQGAAAGKPESVGIVFGDAVDRDLWRGMVQQAFVPDAPRSEEHTSELQSLMRNSYAVFCLKKKKTTNERHDIYHTTIRHT